MKRIRKTIVRMLLTLACCAFLPAQVSAEDLLRSDHPQRYTVQKGDTLWDISGRFLRSPWRWPDIWYVNPQVANPHLIFPGDELELVYIDGRPRLRLNQGPRFLKLTPGVRARPWDGSIPTVPIDAIAPFLTRPYVLNPGEAEGLPYLVNFGPDHILGGAGNSGYVRSLDKVGAKYHVVRPGKPYKDADSGEVLGHEASYIGTVQSTRSGDPATVFFNRSESEAVIGDRLMEIGEERPWSNFTPKAPENTLEGSIISVLNGVSQIGQYNVVVIDRGASDGIEPGTVLRIDQRGETVRDVVTPDTRDTVTLPDEKAGHLMVFRTFERVSFGLVMDATRPLHLLDRVRQP